tara:strand:- start:695 stop:1126 length:432 start_codon:yes stop_codon:yes gene_type:complete
MNLFLKFIVLIIVMSFSTSIANENFFNEAKILYEEEKYDESKFLFQRNIVFNPKDSKSYLYLAKIFHLEENESEEEKNLNTTLLLEPDNEDAMYMLIDMELKRSDYSEVKDLLNNFSKICNLLCDKIASMEKRLNDIEAKEDS